MSGQQSVTQLHIALALCLLHCFHSLKHYSDSVMPVGNELPTITVLLRKPHTHGKHWLGVDMQVTL